MRLPHAVALAIASLPAGCGTSATGLSTPAVSPMPAAPPGVYVANVRLANVAHLDATGNAVLTMTGGVAPLGVGTDDAGNIYIAGDQKDVLVFSPSTSQQTGAFADAAIGGLHGLAVTPGSAPVVFVLDDLLATIDGYPASARGATAARYALAIAQPIDGKPIAIAVDATGTLYYLAGGGPNALAPRVFACRPPGYASCSLTDIAPAASASGLAASGAGTLFVSTPTTIVQYLPAALNAYTVGSSVASGLCGVVAIAAGAATLAASEQCGGPGGSPAIAQFDSATLAPGPVVAGAGAQLSTSHLSTVAVQANAANAGTLYAANPPSDSVTGYCARACVAAPSYFAATGYPGLDGVQALFFAGAYLYTADAAAQAISIYRAPSNSATGSIAPSPVARIVGSQTGICGPASVVLDTLGDIYVANACDNVNDITAYAPIGATTGDYDPVPRTIGGAPATCGVAIACNPQQMIVDARNRLYVTDYGTTVGYAPPGAAGAGSIDIFDGISGSLLAIVKSADIHNPSGIAWTPDGLMAVLSNTPDRGTPEVAFFAPPGPQSDPHVPVTLAPVRVLSGGATQIGGSKPTPFPQIAIDRNGALYVDEFTGVLAFAPNASGNAAPAVLTGSGIDGGTGIAIGSVP